VKLEKKMKMRKKTTYIHTFLIASTYFRFYLKMHGNMRLRQAQNNRKEKNRSKK
jgi:hypothetical protein